MNEILKDSRRSLEMLGAGDIEGAVRLSGEALAKADAQWSAAFNAGGEERGASLDVELQAAYSHIESLAAAGEAGQALSTSLIVLYVSVIDDSESKSISRGRLTLWVISMQLFQQLLETVDVTDEETVVHVRTVISLMVSMLYACYRKAMGYKLDGPMIDDAYAILGQLKGAVQSPMVRVAGKDVDPDDVEGGRQVMADIMGRSRAIGLFAIEE